jgi:hypothetical protein
MLKKLAEVTAMPRHPLTKNRSLRLPVGAPIERDHPITRRRGGVAVDQDNRTPPALLDIAEIHSVTGANHGHKISSRRAPEAVRRYGSAAVHPPPSCEETDGPQLDDDVLLARAAVVLSSTLARLERLDGCTPQ